MQFDKDSLDVRRREFVVVSGSGEADDFVKFLEVQAYAERTAMFKVVCDAAADAIKRIADKTIEKMDTP